MVQAKTTPSLKKPSETKAPHGQWVDDLVSFVGQYVHIQTVDSCYREGRLSAIGWHAFVVGGKSVRRPIDFELNGDPEDRILLERVSEIRPL